MTPDPPGDALAAAALMLARRFHAGATLWCWSPGWPSDAAHVAVEFVHPVIVGKRALPAMAVRDAREFRRCARPGDVLVAIGAGDDTVLVDTVARTPAWGIDAIWLATGPRPAPDTPGYTVSLGSGADQADVVCAYHLLWELTHVCFEHPGVLDLPTEEAPSCPACMDAGDLGEVRAADRPDEATVLIGGVPRTVDLSLVGGGTPGELVVVHAGVAITKLDSVQPTASGPAGL